MAAPTFPGMLIYDNLLRLHKSNAFKCVETGGSFNSFEGNANIYNSLRAFKHPINDIFRYMLTWHNVYILGLNVALSELVQIECMYNSTCKLKAVGIGTPESLQHKRRLLLLKIP